MLIQILLTIFYLIVLIPVALAARLVGKRFLQKGPDPRLQTYWISRLDPGVKNR